CAQSLQTLGAPNATAPLLRGLQRLTHSATDALTVQLGGTLAQSPDRRADVVRLVAQQLGLAVPAAPWHTQRDAWVALGCDVGLLIGSLGTLAKGMVRDASPDQVPAGCLVALAMAKRAPQRVASLLASMPEAYERGLGVWQAEQADWAQLLLSAHASASGMCQALLQGDIKVRTDKL
ncbi:MAG: hypothetical protein U5O12_19315, partial [Rhodoferax sp.]|nr:hypothetical protein [Rhodoferax sp.]